MCGGGGRGAPLQYAKQVCSMNNTTWLAPELQKWCDGTVLSARQECPLPNNFASGDRFCSHRQMLPCRVMCSNQVFEPVHMQTHLCTYHCPTYSYTTTKGQSPCTGHGITVIAVGTQQSLKSMQTNRETPNMTAMAHCLMCFLFYRLLLAPPSVLTLVGHTPCHSEVANLEQRFHVTITSTTVTEIS